MPSYSVCVKWAVCLTTTRHHFEGADKPARSTTQTHVECSLKVDMGTFSLKEEYNEKKGNISNSIVLTRLQQLGA